MDKYRAASEIWFPDAYAALPAAEFVSVLYSADTDAFAPLKAFFIQSIPSDTQLVMPSQIFLSPSKKPFKMFSPRSVQNSIVKKSATFVFHQFCMSLHAFFAASNRNPQFGATDVARPDAPAISRPKPSGIAAPVKISITPRTSRAALTSAVIAPIGPCKRLVNVSQFAATVIARPDAPRIRSPIPRGSAAPEKARIAPRAKRAALTIPTTNPIGPSSVVWIVSQFAATDVARPAAPRISIPIPKGIFAPEKVIIAPIARSAALTIPTTAPTGPSSAV